jgi:hypothetical protein
MSPFPNIAPAFIEEMVAYLLHLFIRGAGGDEAAARHAVLSTLAAHDVANEEEMRLAAEIVSFSFTALEALAKAMDPDLPLNAKLRLRGNANAAHRSGHQCQRTLDKLRKERRLSAEPSRPQAAVTVDADATQNVPTPSAPRMDLSRQQRRELERKAAKAQRKAAERVRLDARLAMRTASGSIREMNPGPTGCANPGIDFAERPQDFHHRGTEAPRSN